MKADLFEVILENGELKPNAAELLEAAYNEDNSILDADENGQNALHRLAFYSELNSVILKQVVEKAIALKSDLIGSRWNHMLPIEFAVERINIAMLDVLAPYYNDNPVVLIRHRDFYEVDDNGAAVGDEPTEIQETGKFNTLLKITGQVDDTLMSYAIRQGEFGLAAALYRNGFEGLNAIATTDDAEASRMLANIADTLFTGREVKVYNKAFCDFVRNEVIKSFKVSQLKEFVAVDAGYTHLVKFIQSELDKIQQKYKADTKYDSEYALVELQTGKPLFNRMHDSGAKAAIERWQINHEEYSGIARFTFWFTNLLSSDFGDEAKEAGATFHEFKNIPDLNEAKIRRYFLRKILNKRHGSEDSDLNLEWLNSLEEVDVMLLTGWPFKDYIVANYAALQAGLVTAETAEAAVLYVVNARLDHKFGNADNRITKIECLRGESRAAFLSYLNCHRDPRKLLNADGVFTESALARHKAKEALVKFDDSESYKKALTAWVESVQDVDALNVVSLCVESFRKICLKHPERIVNIGSLGLDKLSAIGSLSEERIAVLFQDGFNIDKYFDLRRVIKSRELDEHEVFDLAKDAKKRDLLRVCQPELVSIRRECSSAEQFKEILNLSAEALDFRIAYEFRKKPDFRYGRYCSWSDLAKTISEHKIGACSYGLYLAKCHIRQHAVQCVIASPIILMAAVTTLYVYTRIDVVTPVINFASLGKDAVTKVLQPSIDVIIAKSL